MWGWRGYRSRSWDRSGRLCRRGRGAAGYGKQHQSGQPPGNASSVCKESHLTIFGQGVTQVYPTTGLFSTSPPPFSGTSSKLYRVSASGDETFVGALDHFSKGLAKICPVVRVGGTTSLLTSDPGSSSSIALLASGVAALVAIGAGGWYAGRRWLGNGS